MALQKSKWVYKGKTETTKGELGDWVGILGEGDLIVREAVYLLKKKRAFVIGQVYESEFDEETKQAFDLNRATMCVGQKWAQADIIEWTALAEAAERRDRTKKLEKDQGRMSEIERVLAPLRRSYEAMAKRGDWNGCTALETAMLNNLRHRPRSYE